MESGAWSALNQSVLENWIKICGHISPFVYVLLYLEICTVF